MDSAAYLAHLRQELDAFRACLSGDLSAPVEHCGDWTLRELAEHQGRGDLWAAAAVTERRGDYPAPPVPTDPVSLARWFDTASATLLAALDTDPSREAWTFYPPHTVGFWQRRRSLEVLVHRWDAEHALGRPGPLDAELAADGVAEVFDTMAPRQVALGRAAPPEHAIRLTATDTGGSWTSGPDEPVAAITGTAAELLLLLWGRLPHTHETFTWHGDKPAALRVLAGPLVP